MALQTTEAAWLERAHPNIYEAVTLFQLEQVITEISLMQLAAGGLSKRRRKYRNHEKKNLAEKVHQQETMAHLKQYHQVEVYKTTHLDD